MKYLKYTQYIYLFFVPFLLYSGITRLNSGDDSYWLYFFLAVAAIVMFFVRRRFVNKYEENNKTDKNI